MSKPLSIIFIGTPDFAAENLKALVRDTDFKVLAVITQPDMPSGRGMEIKESAVKQLAKQDSLEVWQPIKIGQIIDQIAALEPDFLVTAAYAQIIPENILNVAKYGCINVHASLLPKYRGAGVIAAQVLAGEKTSGVTIMLMDKGLDTGPILAQVKLAVSETETGESLYQKLATAGSNLLLPTLKQFAKGEIKPIAQTGNSNYVGMLKKQDGLIDWSLSAEILEKKVRAFHSWPGAWTWLKGKQLKIIEVEHKTLPLNTYNNGKTFIYSGRLAVQCGQNALIINRLKLEGKPEVSDKDFINGHRDIIGQILG